MSRDEALLRQIRHRVEEELRQREMAFLEFWLQEVKTIDARRHKELAGLQSDLKKLIARMETRLRTLKGGSK
ncbi:MAG: hypothetical protein FJ134_08475 [Deltaproteobacteria bacterium]|nr:hypothetical protein [Deltaproteobacteria bacterium]